MLTIILLTIAGSIIAAVVGTLWYSNKTPMGRAHMRYLGFDKLTDQEKKQKMEAGKSMMPKMYALQFVLSLLMSFAVVFVIFESIHNGLPFSVAVAFPIFTWLCYVVSVVGTNVLWSNCDRALAWKKFFSDIFYYLVVILLISLLSGLFA
ncbi:MAG: DUF1761 domain-containing protein [Patescibacteria group bacterium]|nr:DUF1761 domain-containing protein [Patescibacteria group bacterium]